MDNPNNPGFVLSSSDEEDRGRREDLGAERDENMADLEVPYRCIKCSLDFRNIDDAVNHDRVKHKKITKTNLHKKCRLCFKHFFNRSILKRHYSECRLNYERNHAYECRYCKARFASTHERRVHYSWCEKKLAKFICDAEDCSFRTDWKSSFSRHIKRWHGEQTSYKCIYCTKESLSAEYMRRHEKECPLNPKNLEEFAASRKSKPKTLDPRISKHVCELCKNEFVTQGALINHKKHCNPKYVCEICGVGFQNEGNVVTHQKFCKKMIENLDDSNEPTTSATIPKDASLICEYCNKQLTSKTNLDAHKSMCRLQPPVYFISEDEGLDSSQINATQRRADGCDSQSAGITASKPQDNEQSNIPCTPLIKKLNPNNHTTNRADKVSTKKHDKNVKNPTKAARQSPLIGLLKMQSAENIDTMQTADAESAHSDGCIVPQSPSLDGLFSKYDTKTGNACDVNMHDALGLFLNDGKDLSSNNSELPEVETEVLMFDEPDAENVLKPPLPGIETLVSLFAIQNSDKNQMGSTPSNNTYRASRENLQKDDSDPRVVYEGSPSPAIPKQNTANISNPTDTTKTSIKPKIASVISSSTNKIASNNSNNAEIVQKQKPPKTMGENLISIKPKLPKCKPTPRASDAASSMQPGSGRTNKPTGLGLGLVSNKDTSSQLDSPHLDEQPQTSDITSRVRFIDDVKQSMRFNLDEPTEPIIPQFNSLNPEIQQQIAKLYNRRWLGIMSYIRYGRWSSVYNFRLGNGGFDMKTFQTFLKNHLYPGQRYCFKINFSPGFFLYAATIPYYDEKEQKPTSVGVVSYFHPSHVNFGFFDRPKIIKNLPDFNKFLVDVESIDLLTFCKNARPNTVWSLLFLAQIEVRITKILPYRIGGRSEPKIGCGCDLPAYIKRQRCIVPLTHHHKRKTNNIPVLYNDNLCIFRALALARGYKMDEIDVAAAILYFEFYGEKAKHIKTYPGIGLSELAHFEHVFSINVNIFSIHQHLVDDAENITLYAKVIRESVGIHPDDLNLSLWNNHFSYIKDIAQYCNRFVCQLCGKFFKRGYEYRRHTKTECGKGKDIFPGGIYTPDENIFDMLEAEGLDLVGIDRYYPFRIMYDTEAFQSLKHLPDDTESITYTATHLIASAAVISNVPGFQNPKVFLVSDTISGHEVVVEMLRYMIVISDEAYRLLIII